MTNTPTRPETMVERVARAMSDSLYGDTHTGGWDSMIGNVDLDENFKNRFRKMARAAIEAMRSPTDEMLHIGDEAVDTCTKVDPCETPAKHIWTDMINAALGDGEQ